MKSKVIPINDPKLEDMKQKEWIFKQLSWIKRCYENDISKVGRNIVLDLQNMKLTYLDKNGIVQTEYYYNGNGNKNNNAK